MGHNDLGDFYSMRGDFAMALKCYVRTRDYCTTSKHIITMCLNIIRVSIHMGVLATYPFCAFFAAVPRAPKFA